MGGTRSQVWGEDHKAHLDAEERKRLHRESFWNQPEEGAREETPDIDYGFDTVEQYQECQVGMHDIQASLNPNTLQCSPVGP